MDVSYKNKVVVSLLTAAFFILIDRLLKIYAILVISDINLVSSILKFNYTKNYFIAFSLPLAGPVLLIFIFAIIIVLILISINLFAKKDIAGLPLFFVVAGSASNLFDRLKYGFVIDYFDLKYFTVFNFADVMISFGLLIFLFVLLKQKQPAKNAGHPN